MTARIRRILEKLTTEHAPSITPNGWAALPGDSISKVQHVARELAKYDLMVIAGILPDDIAHLPDIHIPDWVRGYQQMYALLSKSLFPSMASFTATYADQRMPPVIVMHCKATPVACVMSGFINPYVSVRQHRPASQLEMHGLMNVVLMELEAGDLPRATFDQLLGDGVKLLRQMLRSTVHHISLTTFDRPILDVLPVAKNAKPKVPEQKQIEHELEFLPEDDQETTATHEMFVRPVNIDTQSGGTTERLPPVPGLPKHRKKQS